MALKLNERYPGRFDNPTSEYPQGSFKNRSAPGAQDGTYLEKDWANDQLAFFSSLLEDAGVTANGQVDEVGSCQTYDALLQVIQENTADALDTVRINVPSAATVDLTTLAPDTRHIRLTGAATINNFTVAAGQFYFVTVGGTQTVTNSASIVTQNGANMAVVAGDTYCVGATASNVVYVWGWSKVSQVVNQTFTASGSFTAPFAGTYYLSGCGGGGNGGVGGTSGGGGSGAQCLNYPVSLTAGQVVTVTVGGIGGNTSFGATLTMTGGQDGTSALGGDGGTVTVGASPMAFDGQKGGYRTGTGLPGAGGASLFGLFSPTNNGSDSIPPNATGYGAGAAGKNALANQGVGTPGILMIRGQR